MKISNMKRSIIVAMAENRVIGINNKLPWHLPNDLKYFKQVTLGKPIIMGRKTFESIGKPLPGRTNIVVTHNPDWSAAGVTAVTSLEHAFATAQIIIEASGADEVMVIGGEQIYCRVLPQINRIYLTQVHAKIDGDAFFPALDLAQWQEIERQNFAAEGANPYAYSFIVLDKRQPQ